MIERVFATGLEHKSFFFGFFPFKYILLGLSHAKKHKTFLAIENQCKIKTIIGHVIGQKYLSFKVAQIHHVLLKVYTMAKKYFVAYHFECIIYF